MKKILSLVLLCVMLLTMMVSCGIVSADESDDAGQVLNAAFMTYVAAAVSSLMTLLYYLYRAGVFGGSNRD